jgi:hypothetical protein
MVTWLNRTLLVVGILAVLYLVGLRVRRGDLR